MYELDFDKDVFIKCCYPHVIWINKQRSFKDISIVRECYELFHNKKSLFDLMFEKENSWWYDRNPVKVFANCWLDEDFFPEFERIESKDQIDSCHDGILYLHD